MRRRRRREDIERRLRIERGVGRYYREEAEE